MVMLSKGGTSSTYNYEGDRQVSKVAFLGDFWGTFAPRSEGIFRDIPVFRSPQGDENRGTSGVMRPISSVKQG